ncbi:MAG: UbiX family flavin prenyltransferase [Armatimonadetes bacterium]|nr:UbiX family flavin prenyltransferase [Armatimonadota bacterium]
MTLRRVVVGLTGASGAAYALGFLRATCALGWEAKVIASPSAVDVFQMETDVRLGETPRQTAGALREALGLAPDDPRIEVYDHKNFAAPVSSGSYRTAGMIVVPCTAGTLGGIAAGTSQNLIERAAEVTLKEARRLVLVVRETPFSAVQLENMLRLARAGAIVLPANPGFYHRPQRIEDLVDFIVARALDAFAIDHEIGKRWGER